MDRLETIDIRPRGSLRATISDGGFTLTNEPATTDIDQLVLPVWVDGERRLLTQSGGVTLLTLLEDNGLVETGRELWIARPTTTSWTVSWIDDSGERRTAENPEATRPEPA